MNTRLQPETSVLVIVDVQEKLLAAMDAHEQTRVVDNINRLSIAARALGVSTVVTEQYPKGLGATSPRIKDAIPLGAALLEKTSFDACDANDFSGSIPNGRSQVVLVGMESHICVFQTARRLSELGREVHVVEDACCSRTERNHNTARGLWAAHGAVVTCTETVLFDWIADAKHPQFKEISRLIR